MRAAVIDVLDGPSSVRVREVPSPQRKSGEVLVRVARAGVAYPEVLLSWGRYQLRPDLPFVPGSEAAGIVVDADPGSDLKPGDRVAVWCRIGGLAEQVSVVESDVMRLPDEISFDVGASVLLNYGTAYFGLLERGRMCAGERVLVHGAAGGVGVAAIQVAKAFGAHVVAVVSTAEKCAIAQAAGADEQVRPEEFLSRVREVGGVDIVVDPVGGGRFLDSLRCLKPLGRLLVVGFAAGEIPEVKVNRLLLNNIEVIGVGWGAYLRQQPEALAHQWQALLPHLRAGCLAPVLGPPLRPDEISRALRDIDNRQVNGKLVVDFE